MATASSNGFQLIVPETLKSASAYLSGFTVPCHLSPEISAVDMEIRWFKETDCVCLYKNRHMIEGKSYKGNVRQFTDVLEKGDVSLSLTRFSVSDLGDYVCQVTSGGRTEEITVKVKRQSFQSFSGKTTFTHITRMSLGVYRIQIDDQINRTWTEEERSEMEDSALMTELKNPGDLKNFITEKDTKITHLEEHKEILLIEKDQLIQEKDNILLENKQTLEMKDKELETSKHQLSTLRNELQEVKLQLDEQKNKFTHQEKLLEEHKQQQQQYDGKIKRLHSEVERLKEESSTHLAELNEKCKRLEETEILLTVRDKQIKDLEKSKETALEDKDRLLHNSNDKLQQTTTEAEEKQREIEKKNKLMSENETLLENTVKELETSKHQLETLRNELQEVKLELDETGFKNSLLQVQLEENQQVKSYETVSTTPLRRSKSMEWTPPQMSGETAPVMVSGSELRLVLLGSAESEKSVAGNIILNREKNQTDTSAETQQSEIRQEEVDGKQVTVVETPDWFCSGLSLEEVRQDVRRCIRLSAPGPHAFLLVIPVHRSTGVEREMQEKMEEMFGERWWGKTLILFTVTDKEQEKNIEDFVQSWNQEIQRLVKKCGNRFHCLNIHQSEDGSQVSELLEKIEKMMEGNTERSYRSEIYLEVESQIRAMERNIIRDREESKEREKREVKEVIENVQESLKKIEGMIEEHEGDIKQLNERTGELETQMIEERDEEKKKELMRELEKEVRERTELKREIDQLKDQRERERSEMEERHRQEKIWHESEEISAEKKLMKVILSKLHRNMLDSRLKMQEENIKQMEERNRESETLKKNLSELNERYLVMCEFHESALKNLKFS